MTNVEKIRSLNDDELAIFLDAWDNGYIGSAVSLCTGCGTDSDDDCLQCTKNWLLNQEADEDEYLTLFRMKEPDKYIQELTPDELAICRLLAVKWVSRDSRDSTIDGCRYIDLWKEKPIMYKSERTEKMDMKLVYYAHRAEDNIGSLPAHIFPSIRPGECRQVLYI